MDLSTRLSFLFGSEEYVRMKKQLVLLREKMTNNNSRRGKVICSGSRGEGVAYPTSDDDLMFYWPDVRVVNTYNQATQSADVLMVPSEFFPGYCLLLDVNGSMSEIYIYDINGMSFLSSLLWKRDFFIERYSFINGPCISGRLAAIEFDHALSIACYAWPDIATNWIIRNSTNDWPSHEMIQNIIHNGCHVVPIGEPDSPFGQHEWRISFSLAERTLMHSFNHTQFLVYNLLRLTLKRFIKKKYPGVIVSYVMKTSLFHTVENTRVDIWRVADLDKCYRLCLSVLFDYVYHRNCPNYFIPDYNIIRRRISHSNRDGMLGTIRYLHTIGIIGVLHLSGEFQCLDDNLSASMVECKLDSEFMFSTHFTEVLTAIHEYHHTLSIDDIESCLLNFCKFMRLLCSGPRMTGNELDNIMLRKKITNTCLHILHRLCSVCEINKHDYRLFKHLQCLLRLVYNGDLTTGKVTMAAYMYMTGRAESALRTIRQLLSNYPPYVMIRYYDNINTIYKDVMCGRGYNLDYKLKRSYAPSYELYDRYLNAYPHPLRIWISTMDCIALDPLTYTFFLQILCYIQQQNRQSATRSIRCFIDNMNCLKTDVDKIDARMYLGIIKCVQGDSQSASRWLGSAYVMKKAMLTPFKERLSLSVLTYIACLLNRRFYSDMLQNRFQ